MLRWCNQVKNGGHVDVYERESYGFLAGMRIQKKIILWIGTLVVKVFHKKQENSIIART